MEGIPSIFPARNQYDNQGDLMVNSASIFEKAMVTVTIYGAAGAIVPNMYDGDSTTNCVVVVGSGTGIVKWEFEGKPKFKNVFLSCCVDVGSASTTTCYLEGSNNDTDWTEIANKTFTVTAAVVKTIIGTNVNYKYLRGRLVTAHASSNAGISDIRGTI